MVTASSDKTLLLIDDEYMIRQVVQVCLENLSNWKTTIATSGKEGLTTVAQVKPDAILLDMMMPEMNGFDFLEKLQADDEIAHIPVILLTSCTTLLSHRTLLDLGCKGVISKPFEPITLVSQIAYILGW
ncbi:response regulator [Pseudanabaena yagii]|uniref:Response regulator n=1 Tax=Pseudanabaena yagii GIHE-NHR1 TaxID=2722753 RepID=A0ABX1LSB0_9CYAN|nr:response regulator [Pseudanabaena yagii]NMF59014.1 response regulator [Pseudanabaena yagii GIHE-NHR1]